MGNNAKKPVVPANTTPDKQAAKAATIPKTPVNVIQGQNAPKMPDTETYKPAPPKRKADPKVSTNKQQKTKKQKNKKEQKKKIESSEDEERDSDNAAF